MEFDRKQTRRCFLQTGSAAVVVVTAPYFFTGSIRSVAEEQKSDSANDRPILGCIGTGGREMSEDNRERFQFPELIAWYPVG